MYVTIAHPEEEGEVAKGEEGGLDLLMNGFSLCYCAYFCCLFFALSLMLSTVLGGEGGAPGHREASRKGVGLGQDLGKFKRPLLPWLFSRINIDHTLGRRPLLAGSAPLWDPSMMSSSRYRQSSLLTRVSRVGGIPNVKNLATGIYRIAVDTAGTAGLLISLAGELRGPSPRGRLKDCKRRRGLSGPARTGRKGVPSFLWKARLVGVY